MFDPLYYTMRFSDGLRYDIKSMVMIQHPKDLDTAFVFAQLQKDIVENTKKDFKKFDYGHSEKSYARGSLPLPPPPKGTQAAGRYSEPKSLITAQAQVGTDRLSSIYAYQKAQGLCYKCRLPYARGHRCPDSVPAAHGRRTLEPVSATFQWDTIWIYRVSPALLSPVVSDNVRWG